MTFAGFSIFLMKVTVEFSGGLELVFDKQKTLQIEVPSDKKDFNIQDLIVLLRDNYLKGKPEFFVGPGDVLRPGILVLINDADWELEGKQDYVLQEKDNISFISTLHGG